MAHTTRQGSGNPWLVDAGPMKPNSKARSRLKSALREHPSGLSLADAACALSDPDRVEQLRGSIDRRVRLDARTTIEQDAANILLGAVLDNDPVCELRWLAPGLGSEFAAATSAAISQFNFFALDFKTSQIETPQGRFPARIFAKSLAADATALTTAELTRMSAFRGSVI